jgi:hypothetical protein
MPDDVIQQVSAVYGVAMEEVLKRVQQSAFQAAVYLLRRVMSVPLKATKACGFHVQYLQCQVEVWKGSPNWDVPCYLQSGWIAL